MRPDISSFLLSRSRRPASVESQEGPLLALLDAAVGKAFSALCRPVQKNLAVLTVAFLRVLGAVRSGHGQLSLAALFRVLPTPGTPHAREKRLHRPRLDPRSVTDGLARLIFGSRGRGLWPILFDQTKAGATQALFAGVPFQGRALPLAVYTFQYPWQEKTARRTHRPSAARLYHGLLLGIATGSFTGSGKSSARFGDSPSTPAPRKLSDVECALRGAGHVVAPALERTGPGAT